jgi:hypothetical protein
VAPFECVCDYFVNLGGETKHSKVYSVEWYGSESLHGLWLNAHAAGQEVATYEGDYNAVRNRHGEGTLTWANGDVYVGWFKNGFMEDRGTITFHDSEISRGSLGLWCHSLLIC